MVADDWVVSADGGGSSTDVLLANIPLKIALLKRGGGTNPNVYGDDGIERLRISGAGVLISAPNSSWL